MTLVPGLDVEGPVRAEVFMVCHDGRQILLTGPDGPTPWHIESGAGEHPIDLAHRIVADTVGDPCSSIPRRGVGREKP